MPKKRLAKCIKDHIVQRGNSARLNYLIGVPIVS